MTGKKICPAMYDGSHGWSWVQLAELCEMTGLTGCELFSRYGALSKDAPDGILAVEMMGGEFKNVPPAILSGIERALPTASMIQKWRESTFVPAGWAMDVLKARSDGYTRVTLEEMYLEEEQGSPDFLKVTHHTGFHNQYYVAVGYKD